MTTGDAPPLMVNPPELSDEAIYAISEYLNEICRSFENHYYARIRRHCEERERVYKSSCCTAWDAEEPF